MTLLRVLLTVLLVAAAPAAATPHRDTAPAGRVAPDTAGFDPFTQATIDSPQDARVPLDARFVDQDGRTVVLRDLIQGDVPVIFAPVYYECPNICSVSTGGLFLNLSRIVKRYGDDYRVVVMSFNATDGPDQARLAQKKVLTQTPEFAGANKARFLTGDDTQIRTVTEALGYGFAWDDRIGQFAHANAFAVLTPDGALSRWINAVAARPADLRLAIAEAADGATRSIADFALMLCYAYDPQTGRYSSLITGSLKAGAAVTVVVLLGGIGLALWREARR